MNRNLSPHHALDARHAKRLIFDLIRLGHKPTATQYTDFLPRIQPFLALREIEGADSKEQSNYLLALMWAAMGDAHVAFGEFDKAASAYSFSTRLRPFTSVFDSYAKIVLERNYSDHYPIAIKSFLEGSKKDTATPLWKKIPVHFVWMLARPFSYFDFLKRKKSRKTQLAELEKRVCELESHCST